MDRMIYTALSGLKHTLEQQATHAHNLANATTTGFRAQLDSFRAVPVVSEGVPTRAFVVDATVGADFRPGALAETGRALDAAIHGDGWFAVLRADGSEGYTRNGAFRLNENGILETADGLTVQGDGGPITVPPDAQVSIGRDGTVSAVSTSVTPSPVMTLGRLKLVNPPTAELTRATDGLFVTRSGQPAEADAAVTLQSGALEGSNVNVVESLIGMIALARQFDLQQRLLQNAQNNADKASQLLSLGA